MLTWVPYAAVTFYTAFFDAQAISSTQTMIPGMMAKFARLWTPLYFMITKKEVRDNILCMQRTYSSPPLSIQNSRSQSLQGIQLRIIKSSGKITLEEQKQCTEWIFYLCFLTLVLPKKIIFSNFIFTEKF